MLLSVKSILDHVLGLEYENIFKAFQKTLAVEDMNSDKELVLSRPGAEASPLKTL